MVKKQAIVFDMGPEHDPIVGEQTMDLLLHYAQTGIAEAEQVMREQPELYSENEIMDFVANKVVLAKAPDILQDYKRKLQEFERMHEKVQSVVGKCERIVRNHDIRQSHDSDNYVDPHKKKQVISDKPEVGVIRYTSDGQVLMNGAPGQKKPRKRIQIELPRHNKY